MDAMTDRQREFYKFTVLAQGLTRGDRDVLVLGRAYDENGTLGEFRVISCNRVAEFMWQSGIARLPTIPATILPDTPTGPKRI